MAKENKTTTSETAPHSLGQPYRVRLPGFIRDEEVGVGDIIKRATYSVGIHPCGGCSRRAAKLNRWIVFTP